MAKNDINEFLGQFLGELEKTSGLESDPRTGKATTGSRASENESDLKAQSPGESVNEGGEINSTPGGSNTATNSIGTQKGETGTDVPAVKSKKDDPGTTSVAKAAQAKYAGATTNDLINGANDLLASISILSKQAESTAASTVAPVMPGQVPTGSEKKKTKAEVNAKVETAKADAVKTASDTVQLSRNDFELIKQAASNWAEFVGYVEGQGIADQVLKTASAPVESASNELEKYAEAQSANLFNLADKASTDLIDFFVGAQKQASDELAAGSDPAQAAAASGQIDPAALQQQSPQQVSSEGQQLSPEIIQMLLQALEQNGVSPADLGAGGDALQGHEDSPADDDSQAPEGSPADDKLDKAQAAAAGAEAGSNDEKDDTQKQASLRQVTDIFAKFLKAAGTRQKNLKKVASVPAKKSNRR